MSLIAAPRLLSAVLFFFLHSTPTELIQGDFVLLWYVGQIGIATTMCFSAGEEKARLMTSGNELLLLGLGIKRHAVQTALWLTLHPGLLRYKRTAYTRSSARSSVSTLSPLLGLAGWTNASVTSLSTEDLVGTMRVFHAVQYVANYTRCW